MKTVTFGYSSIEITSLKQSDLYYITIFCILYSFHVILGSFEEPNLVYITFFANFVYFQSVLGPQNGQK